MSKKDFLIGSFATAALATAVHFGFKKDEPPAVAKTPLQQCYDAVSTKFEAQYSQAAKLNDSTLVLKASDEYTRCNLSYGSNKLSR